MTKVMKSLKPGVYGVRQGDGNEDDEVLVVEEEQEVDEQVDDELDVEESETEEETEAEVDTEEPDESEEEQNADNVDTEDDDGEVIVTIGDEEPPQDKEDEKAPEWVRELRKSHREMARENRELKEKLKAQESPAQKAIQVGPKPKLEDFDYDTDKYEQELTAWHDRRRKADEQEAEAKANEKAVADAWQNKLNAYGEAKDKLKVKDFDDAEEVVLSSMNQMQQGIIIQGADNPALVVYALGKNGDRTKELASINDPVKFAFAVAKLEKDLKVRNRKAPPPPPEKKVSGTAPKSGSVDSTLERLRAEAERTGNYSKVHKYKQQQRLKAKK